MSENSGFIFFNLRQLNFSRDADHFVFFWFLKQKHENDQNLAKRPDTSTSKKRKVPLIYGKAPLIYGKVPLIYGKVPLIFGGKQTLIFGKETLIVHK